MTCRTHGSTASWKQKPAVNILMKQQKDIVQQTQECSRKIVKTGMVVTVPAERHQYNWIGLHPARYRGNL